MNLTLRPPVAGGALALSIYLLACLLVAAHADAVESADAAQVLHFEIPPQSLASALTLFSETAGYSVLIGGDLVRGRMSSGVRGDLPARVALQALLEGSGLAARYIGSKAYTLAPVSIRDESADDQLPLAVAQEQVPAGGAGNFPYLLQAAITRVLCIAQPVSFGRYRLGLQLWLTGTGRIADVRLLQSSGTSARDLQVLASLRDMEVGAVPPAGLPQPLTILLTPRPDPAADCRYFADQAR